MARLPDDNDETLSTVSILDAARQQVRRFGEAKTNIVDIARALGTSHTTIYRHFRSKADVFDAIVQAAMRDEENLARRFVDADGPAADRLRDLILTLHPTQARTPRRRPRQLSTLPAGRGRTPGHCPSLRCGDHRNDRAILEDGVRRTEFEIDDVRTAAEVVRDAATVYVHAALVASAVDAGSPTEPALLRTMATLNTAFEAGVAYSQTTTGVERNARQDR